MDDTKQIEITEKISKSVETKPINPKTKKEPLNKEEWDNWE